MGRFLPQFQIFMLPLVIAAVMFAPPARGQIAVVSLTGEQPAAFAARVRDAGAYPLKADGEGRTLVAFGDDPVLFFRLLAKGLVALRVPLACGSANSA